MFINFQTNCENNKHVIFVSYSVGETLLAAYVLLTVNLDASTHAAELSHHVT